MQFSVSINIKTIYTYFNYTKATLENCGWDHKSDPVPNIRLLYVISVKQCFIYAGYSYAF